MSSDARDEYGFCARTGIIEEAGSDSGSTGNYSTTSSTLHVGDVSPEVRSYSHAAADTDPTLIEVDSGEASRGSQSGFSASSIAKRLLTSAASAASVASMFGYKPRTMNAVQGLSRLASACTSNEGWTASAVVDTMFCGLGAAGRCTKAVRYARALKSGTSALLAVKEALDAERTRQNTYADARP